MVNATRAMKAKTVKAGKVQIAGQSLKTRTIMLRHPLRFSTLQSRRLNLPKKTLRQKLGLRERFWPPAIFRKE